MDTHQIPLRSLTIVGLVLATTTLGVSGCGSRAAVKQQVREKIKQEIGKAGKEQASSTLSVTGDRNNFAVDNAKGQRILEAKVGRVEGAMRPDQGIQGPVTMQKLQCRLFQEGKPQLDLVAPEATWDGKQLLAGKTVHGTTPNGDTVIDAQKAIWTAEGGLLDLDGAKLVSLERGKPTFTAEGAKALVDGDVVTMPAGVVGSNPEGKRLKANHVRWFRGSGKLEARGDVQVADKDTEVYGQQLSANTKLKKGRFIGKTRVLARAGKIGLSKKANH